MVNHDVVGTRYVTEMLNLFHDNLQKEMDEYLDSVEYEMILKFKGARVSEYCASVYKLIRRCIPSEIDLDYVYYKRYTKEKTIKLVIRGDAEGIESFERSKTFYHAGQEEDIFCFIAETFDDIIRNEYALYNLEVANDTMETLLKNADCKYTVKYITTVNKHYLLKDISDKCVIIYCDIDKAIALGDTVMFTGAPNVLGKSERSKTNFKIRNDLTLELRKIPTIPQFLGSHFPIYAFLTKFVEKRNVQQEIERLYPRDIDEFESKEYGIGYTQTENTYALVRKDEKGYSYVLTTYHKQTLEALSV